MGVKIKMWVCKLAVILMLMLPLLLGIKNS